MKDDELDALIDEQLSGDEIDKLIEQNIPQKKPGFWENLAQGAASRGEALARGVLQGGTFGFGDEIVGGVGAPILKRRFDKLAQGGVRLTPQAQAEARSLGIDVPIEEKAPSLADLYETTRNTDRAANRAAEEAHRGFYVGGQIAGGLATGKALPLSPFKAAQGAPLLARMGVGAANALPAGALFGAGASEADLMRPDAKQLLKLGSDVGTTGLAAAVLGGGVPAVGAALAKAPAAFKNAGINIGRKVLTHGADQLSKRAPIKAEAVEEALKSDAIRFFFGTNKGALKRLDALAEAQGGKYDDLLTALEQKGVKGPRFDELGRRFEDAAQNARDEATNELIPRMFEREGRIVQSRAGPGPGREGPFRETLPLRRGESFKRFKQREARYGDVKDTIANEAKQEVASIYRQATEDAIDQAAQAAPEDAALQSINESFVPVKQRMGRLLEAHGAAERGAARAAQRRSIGPYEALAGIMGASHGGAAHGPAGLLYGPAALVTTKLANTFGPSAAAKGLYNLGRAGQWLSAPASRAAARFPSTSAAFGAVGEEQPFRIPVPAFAMTEEERRQQEANANALAFLSGGANVP